MKNQIFIRIDGDNIGDKIELALMNEKFAEAQEIHNSVQGGIRQLQGLINSSGLAKLLLVGSDDLLFTINSSNFNEKFIHELKDIFYTTTGHTLSIGIGKTLKNALDNLKRAKLSGRNKIVTDLRF